jgi:hypothetical protein
MLSDRIYSEGPVAYLIKKQPAQTWQYHFQETLKLQHLVWALRGCTLTTFKVGGTIAVVILYRISAGHEGQNLSKALLCPKHFELLELEPAHVCNLVSALTS